MKIKVPTGIISTAPMLSVSQSWVITLKLSHNQDKSHPVHKAMEFPVKKDRGYSNGDIVIRIYPNGTLDTQQETMELIHSGAIPLVRTSTVETGALGNSCELFSLPYLFRDRDHYYQTIQGDIGRKVPDSARSKGHFGLTFYDGGAHSLYSNKPALKPDGLKGMKVRVQPNPSMIEMTRVMGGNPVPLDYGELYTALWQGVIDMVENSVMALTTMCHGEVAKSFSLDEHTMVPDVVLMNNATLGKLSPENQAVILKAAKESMSYMKDLWSGEEKQELTKLNKMDVKVYQADEAPFIEKIQPVHANFTKNDPALVPILAGIQVTK